MFSTMLKHVKTINKSTDETTADFTKVREDGMAVRPQEYQEEQVGVLPFLGLLCYAAFFHQITSLKATKVKWKPKRDNWQGGTA